MTLELAALRWLKWEKRCAIVLYERSPNEWTCGRPDVLGVTKDRYATEIEIKRSLSDFRADARKASRRNRDLYPKRFPKFFYYLVPEKLREKVQEELPKWAGLMIQSTDPARWYLPEIIVPAPVNRESDRYSVKHCLVLVRLMANQIVAQADTIHGMNRQAQEEYGLDYRI